MTENPKPITKEDIGLLIIHAADLIAQKIEDGQRREWRDGDPVPSRNFSPQLVSCPKTTTTEKIMLIVPYENVFRLKRFSWKVFSAQAKQDLIVRFKVSSRRVFQSGQTDFEATVTNNTQLYEEDTRTVSFNGAPLTSISNAGTDAYVDQFAPDTDFEVDCPENEKVIFEIENQSTLFDHWIRLHISGTLLPAKYFRGRKHNNLPNKLKERGFFGECPTA